MPRTVEIKVPAADKTGKIGLYVATGIPCTLDVGGTKHRFILQQGPAKGDFHILTHRASGRRLKDLREYAVAYYASKGRSLGTMRDVAQGYLIALVEKNGADLVNQKLAAAEIINP